MTPLKAASRAYVNAGTESGNSEKTIYDAFSDRDQLEADDAMRAALMALAEAGLPLVAIEAGAHWQSDLQSLSQDLRTSYVEASFRAILRSICHADTEKAEQSVSPLRGSSNESRD